MKLPFWPIPKGYRDIDLGLERVYQLLERLDNPHLKIPPAIHLAGTNGKGSTLSFLKAIFEESGLKIHTYTSPHLVNFNERIVLAGEEISDDFLTEILTECKNAAEQKPEIPVTFFEGITVAAFLAFSRVEADLLLLETGMGGRLDATNVLPEVICSIITPISLDHTDFLGNNVADIALEKAGIIKKDCATIVGKQDLQALKSIKKQALQLNAQIQSFSEHWELHHEEEGFRFRGFNKDISLPKPSLKGDHQIENASLAIAASLTQKKFEIKDHHIKSALIKTSWPARLQKIDSGKFYDQLPNNCELYLDGGHNAQAAKTIAAFLKKESKCQVITIFAMLEDKDRRGFLKEIAGEVDHLIAMEIPGEEKSHPAQQAADDAKSFGIRATTADNLDHAFKNALSLQNESKQTIFLICGSLYLAGSFLAS